MSTNQINISNLRNYLTQIVANQAKVTEPAYANKYALVNAVATTSSTMNINPKTGTITVPTSTGPIQVPQPVINPLPVNSTTAFVSTSNNQVSVTSQGSEDIIITSTIEPIKNIFDLTNSGYTKNNSLLNLYDTVSTNYWNPQINQYATDPYNYNIRIIFENIGSIFKVNILNSNEFSGFKNITIYPTSNPSNYIDITPLLDIDNKYLSNNVALLLKNDGSPFFPDENDLTLDFDLEPQLYKDTFYQFGKSNGIIYENNGTNVSFRTSNYIYNTNNISNFNDWTFKNVTNVISNTGTINSDNNYTSSLNGENQIVFNQNNYSISNNYGSTWTTNNLSFDSIVYSNDMQYLIGYKVNSGPTYKYYKSSDYGQTFTEFDLIVPILPPPSILQEQTFNAMRSDGLWAFYVQTPENGSTSNQILLIITSIDVNRTADLYPIINANLSSNFDNTTSGVNAIREINGIFTSGSGPTFKSFIVISCYDPVLNCGNVQFISNLLSPTQVVPPSPPFIPFPAYWFDSSRVFTMYQNRSSNSSEDGLFITAFGLDKLYTQLRLWTSFDGQNFNQCSLPSFIEWSLYNSNGIYVKESKIYISQDGTKQILHVVYGFSISTPVLPYTQIDDLCITYYSNNTTGFISQNGATWTKSTTSAYLLNSIGNISINNDGSVITIFGGKTYTYNGVTRTDPITYTSYDYGENWVISSSVLPSTELQKIAFSVVGTKTEKTFFEVKNINQQTVLSMSNNGLKLSEDLRVNNADAYVIGGKMVIGPDSASSLLNDYELNVDGTILAQNIILLSDKRLKNIIGIIDDKDAYEKLSQLDIVKFNYIHKNEENIGLIAQDVNEIIPEAINISDGEFIQNNESTKIENLHSINYNVLLCYLISSLKYNSKIMKNYEERIKQLEYKFNNL